ncbi:MAG TPA: hypothetical protein VKE70_18560 [Candidatus Solibacter sp.]|nr:hypothetical protein [Candidatus Solibacter sp.]
MDGADRGDKIAVMRLVLIAMASSMAFAQPRPLRNIAKPTPVQRISILSADISELRPAHGGPSYFKAKRPPIRGAAEVMEATLYGQESVGVVRFELVDDAGRVVQDVPAVRTGAAVDSDGYMLKVTVPDLPFRLRIRGSDLRGQPFSNTLARRFVPVEGTPSAPIPTELESHFQTGDLRMSRAGISDAEYEPLISATGNPLGIRVRFTVRFGAPGYYDVTPHVFPVYQEFRWRGEIGMREIEFAGAKQYEADKDYRLTFDMIPSYVGRNPGASNYCVQTPPRVAVFEEIMVSRQPVKYRVDISSLDFVSETESLPPAREWLEGFRREGASQCR